MVHTKQQKIANGFIFALLCLGAVVMIAPLLWILLKIDKMYLLFHLIGFQPYFILINIKKSGQQALY
jgi:nucleoside permease NupC